MPAYRLPLHREMTDAETELFMSRGVNDPGGLLAPTEPRNDPDPLFETPAADRIAEGRQREDSADFVPVATPRPRVDGWVAWRQRKFIEVLAQSGSVSEAASSAGVTPRSAYRFRARPDAQAFDRAWQQALVIASNRLTAIAFERAIHGTLRQRWHKGQLIGEERTPSDRLLMYLLQHYDRARYGNLSGLLPCDIPDPRPQALDTFCDTLATLEDSRFPIEGRLSGVATMGDPIDPRKAV